jgi:PAS domain S-box-containing protein
MPQSEPVTILIVSEHAEEIKLVTISLRGFFTDSRIDVAYSAEEAKAMASAAGQEWAAILVDEDCLAGASTTFLGDLKRRAPSAGILLLSQRADSASALQALQAGADFFLAKNSQAFLTELLFCTKEALEKRALRQTVDRMEIRHQQLIESLDDVFYELDADGRFLTVSPNLPSLLGYRPEELVGHPYDRIFSQEEQTAARFRFNERRSGARGARRIELLFQGKPTQDGAVLQVTAEVSARGLYDSSRRFLGTVGIIRDVSQSRKQELALQELQRQRRSSEDMSRLAQQLTALSRDLQQPLSTLLDETRQLLRAVRGARLDDRIEELTAHAAAATQLGGQLERIIQDSSQLGGAVTVNSLLEDLLAGIDREHEGGHGILTEFAPDLPMYPGDRERTVQLFHRLLAYARAYLRTVGRPRRLIMRTSGVGVPIAVETPALFPLTPPSEVEVEVFESDRERPIREMAPFEEEPVDLLELYQLTGQLGGTLDVSAPASGPLHLLVRLPVGLPPPVEQTPPSAPKTFDHLPAPEAPEPGEPALAPATALTGAATDRRATPRIPATLPAQVTVGSTTWDGTVINLGLGGACIALPSEFPPIALQEAYIVARTAVGILELAGFVYERPPSAPVLQSGIPLSHAVVVFHAPKATEAAVLASLIEAARDQSLAFAFEVLLAAGPLGLQAAGRPLTPDVADHDRRETVRVPVTLPVRLELTQHPEPVNRLTAQMLNISRDGACLLVKDRPDRIQGLVTLHFPPAHTTSQPGSHEPGAPESVLPAQIVWSTPDPTAPSALRTPSTPHAARVGVRFQTLTPYAEHELNRLIRQHLLSHATTDALAASAPVVSVYRECRNARGQAIAIMDDHLRQSIEPAAPVVILSPGYGQTARDYAAFSYYLAQHRLRILRYDHTNHVGISEGELQHTTLRSMQNDLSKVVEFVHDTWPSAPITVIASDLAARTALKMAVQTRPLDLLLLVNPAIDVGSMLMTVHGHDLVADYRYGLRRGIANLLGLNINVDQFVGDLVAGQLADQGSTLDDLRLIRSPLAIVTSPTSESSPLPPADLPHAFMTALSTQTRLLNIPTSLTSQDFPRTASRPPAFQQILEHIASVLAISVAQPELDPSAYRALARQLRVEQEHTRLRHNCSQISREALCAAHLQQLPQLGNLHEYRKLLDDLYGLLSPLDPGTATVDADIGPGDLTRATLVNYTYRAGQGGWTGQPSPLMVGLGRSGETITQARHAVRTLQRELSTGFVGRLTAMPPLTIDWVQADWAHSLPFKTGSLNRLICNLSLPFVSSPLTALQEWYRALHPEGRLILTTFHPDTDLSTIYRQQLRHANQDEFNAQSQALLHYFGRLREAIRHGVLHTFDRAALSALLRRSGMTSIRILPIFNGQALAAIVEKRNSSSPAR